MATLTQKQIITDKTALLAASIKANLNNYRGHYLVEASYIGMGEVVTHITRRDKEGKPRISLHTTLSYTDPIYTIGIKGALLAARSINLIGDK